MDNDDLPICRYGTKCYRKNPDHFKKFRHLTIDSKEAEAEKEKEDGYESDTEGSTSQASKHSGSDIEPFIRKKAKTDKGSKDDDEIEGKGASVDGSNGNINSSHPLPRQTSHEDRKNLIKQYFLFDMPDDFYALWDLATALHSKDPCNAFAELGLVLCGPYDVLSGKFDMETLGADEFLLYWRYYYDVPEFQTVIREDANGDSGELLFHIGYLRDIVQESGPIVCSNDGTDCKLTIVGDNLFAAVNDYAKSRKASGGHTARKLTNAVVAAAEKHKFSLEKDSKRVKDRKKKTVAKTFHGAGIVVPLEGDVGYRPLGTSDDQLHKILKAFSDDQDKSDKKGSHDLSSSKLQELITYVQFANDECDFGMGYELGIDLFCTGYTSLHPYVDQLLSVAYALLKREEFKTILNVHLAKRQKGMPSIAPP